MQVVSSFCKSGFQQPSKYHNFSERLASLNMYVNSLSRSKLGRTLVGSSQRWKSTLDKAELMKYLSTPPYTLPNRPKIACAPMVYISGEEMTHYTMELM
jgi:hypothetical protein